MSEVLEHWWVSNSDNAAAYTEVDLPAAVYRFVAPDHGRISVAATDALMRQGSGMFTLAAPTRVRMTYGGRGRYAIFRQE